MIEDSGQMQEYRAILMNNDLDTLSKRSVLWVMAFIGMS